MWNLKEDAGSVTCGFIRASCPTVMQIYQYLFAVLDDCVVSLAGDVYNCTDTAAVMLTARLIQTGVSYSSSHKVTYVDKTVSRFIRIAGM